MFRHMMRNICLSTHSSIILLSVSQTPASLLSIILLYSLICMNQYINVCFYIYIAEGLGLIKPIMIPIAGLILPVLRTTRHTQRSNIPISRFQISEMPTCHDSSHENQLLGSPLWSCGKLIDLWSRL